MSWDNMQTNALLEQIRNSPETLGLIMHECKEQKRLTRKLGKLFKSKADDPWTRDKYLTARKSYKAMVRRKKRQAALNLHDELESFRMRSPIEPQGSKHLNVSLSLWMQ